MSTVLSMDGTIKFEGDVGPQGIGISGIELTSTTGLVKTYTITFTNGNTFDFQVEDGKGIASVSKEGTGAKGTTDTYTITYTDGTTYSFSVYNGADGSSNYEDILNKPTLNGVTIDGDLTTGDLGIDTSDLTNNAGFITKEVNNLTNYELKTDVGHSILMSIDSSTYVLTVSLKNSAGTVLNTQTVDLPLETMVIGGSYDSVNKKVILTLKNGSTIEFSVADLISGLQSEITPSNKLSADLVDDTSTTHKFTTSSDITKLSGIESGAEVNVIETVKVDGSALTVTDKAVNITGLEKMSNKVTYIYSDSTDTQYPSAKAVYRKTAPLSSAINALLNQIPKGTAEEEYIHIEDSSDLPIRDVVVEGNTSQDGTPTPTEPVPIKVVTGDVTANVVGKNYFLLKTPDYTGQDARSGYGGHGGYVISNNTINFVQRYGAVAWEFDNLKIGETYTFSAKIYNIGSTATLHMGVNNYSGSSESNAGQTGKSATQNQKVTISHTFVATAQNRLSISTGTVDGINATFSDIQLEQGSTVTDYEPYTAQSQLLSLGDKELAGIGDYKDKLFKAIDGNKVYDSLTEEEKATLTAGNWYKYKVIQKLSSTDIVSVLNNIRTDVTDAIKTTLRQASYVEGTYVANTGLSNYFAISTSWNSGTLHVANTTNYGIQLCIDNSIIGITENDTSAEKITKFKAWITNAGVIIYVVLQNPVFEEITDTTLISQLDTLYDLTTYKNISNIFTTTTNENPILDVTYRKDINTIFPQSIDVKNIVKCTQQEYDDMTSHDSATLYLIEEEE